MKPGFYKLNIQISITLGSVAIHRPSSVITMFADVLVPNWHQAINSIHADSILVILAQESYISRGTDVMLQLLNKQWSRRAGGGVGGTGREGSATLFFVCVCVGPLTTLTRCAISVPPAYTATTRTTQGNVCRLIPIIVRGMVSEA